MAERDLDFAAPAPKEASKKKRQVGKRLDEEGEDEEGGDE